MLWQSSLMVLSLRILVFSMILEFREIILIGTVSKGKNLTWQRSKIPVTQKVRQLRKWASSSHSDASFCQPSLFLTNIY